MKQLLTVEDIYLIEQLQREVVDALDNKEILQPLSISELDYILRGNGLMIGVFDEDKLIACRALLTPESTEDEHLGLDVGARDLTRVLYQEVSIVHPAYRGRGLQQQMAQWVMAHVDRSAYDWVCATVMPYNIASLKDKFAQRMYVHALKLKYGGKLRYVFGKQLGHDRVFTEDPVTVRMGDTVMQQQLLAEGYVGVEMRPAGDDWLVTYKK